MRLGIMGGTFDPIHYGHLFIAEEARARFQLNRVLFVPSNCPPHKPAAEVTPAPDRLTMTQLAVASNPAFECSDIEVNRPGASYTVETLTRLRSQSPEAELFFVTGVDAIADILTWRRHEEVVQLATFIAATRPGYDLSRLKDRLPAAYLERILRLDAPALNISSTEIRTRLRQGLPVRYLLPDSVLEYIHQHRLYGAAPAAERNSPTR